MLAADTECRATSTRPHSRGVVQQVRNSHSIRVHALSRVKVVVTKVLDNLLGVLGRALFKSLDLFLARALGLLRLLDGLHVGCLVLQIRRQSPVLRMCF